MSKKCPITGKGPVSGNNRSHSLRATGRRWNVNRQKRKLGIDGQVVDMPMDYAQARLTAEIIDAVRKYEPRVRVTRVSFGGDGADGKMIPTVKVVIGNE